MKGVLLAATLPHVSISMDRAAALAELDGARISDLGAERGRRRHDGAGWRARIAATGIQALLAALEARDPYTRSHSEAVVDIAEAVCMQLGLDDRAVDEVRQVALLHDLGKIALPDHVLAGGGALDDRDWDVVRRHSDAGARIVERVDGLSHLAPAIRAAHERWDGRGYPDGLRAERIPLPSRVVAVCDAYDAMVSHRPYRRAMPRARALAEIARAAGTQFCPTCAGALPGAV